ncbi:hypothetical protein [Pseudothauera rhizosphaerae]|uniref:Uncharacterized protein n=1 Tax=Pseudothauera rhizosphaerae TaxID=2565932 RepID=A0A4S4AAG6_9RHOO|nr:hypothetical protein [Pseudothauera rhizosphaerae]THF55904.1 hypothetical protein E6O51_20170 [Pseudothauera rhizosphaerae]
MAAEDFVADIIEQALTTAAEKAAEFTDFAEQAITASSGSASINYTPVAFTPDDVEPNVTIPEEAAGLDMELYDEVRSQIVSDLTTAFSDFFSEFFPTGGSLAAAQSWLTNAITNGGTGIKPEIENQIWDRECARTLRETNRSGEEIIGIFAARGFPLPSGALQHQISLNQQNALQQNAESSRARAIEAARMEVENVRFAVAQAIDYMTNGIAAAGDYVRIIALGPQIAEKLATSSSDAQARLISAANGFFNTRVRLQEIDWDVIKFNALQKVDVAKADLHEFSNRLTARTRTLGDAAQAAGNQAAAALNAVHASAQVAVQSETS